MQTIHDIPNEPLCLNADSDVIGKQPYRLEMEAFDGNGMCNCEDFLRRKLGPLQRGARSDGTKYLCKHLIRAHIYQSRKFIALIKEKADEALKRVPVHGTGVAGGRFRNASYDSRRYGYED